MRRAATKQRIDKPAQRAQSLLFAVPDAFKGIGEMRCFRDEQRQIDRRVERLKDKRDEPEATRVRQVLKRLSTRRKKRRNGIALLRDHRQLTTLININQEGFICR